MDKRIRSLFPRHNLFTSVSGVLLLVVCAALIVSSTPARNTPPTRLPSGPLNVRDFGAAGDDNDDDSQAFDAAIAAARSSNRAIFVPAGEYMLSRALNLTGSGDEGRTAQSVSLVGESVKGVMFVPLKDGMTMLKSDVYSRAENFSILCGDRKAVTAIALGSQQARISNFYVENCERGISIDWTNEDTLYNLIESGVITSCNYGIYLATKGAGENAQNLNTFINVKVYDAKAEGLHIEGADHNTFIGLDVEGCNVGVKLIKGSSNIIEGWLEKNRTHLWMSPSMNYGTTQINMEGLQNWASGVLTTGTIHLRAPTTLLVESATGIVPGKPMVVVGAGANGSLLITNVAAVSGNIVTLERGASTAVDRALVRGPYFSPSQAVTINGEQYHYSYGTHEVDRLVVGETQLSPQSTFSVYGGFKLYPIPSVPAAEITAQAGLKKVVFQNAELVPALQIDTEEHAVQISSGAKLYSGPGSPEGRVSAGAGSLYLRTDGGQHTSLYVKELPAGNTGWVAK